MPGGNSKGFKATRASPIEKQYAALCFRHIAGSEEPVQLLLITSCDNGRWVIPKGWGDAKTKPHETAQREAWVKAGVVGRIRKKPFGYYTFMKKLPDESSVMVVVQVHLIHAFDIADDFPEKGQRVLRWFSPAAAATALPEVDLKHLVLGLRDIAMQLLNLMPSVWQPLPEMRQLTSDLRCFPHYLSDVSILAGRHTRCDDCLETA